MALGTLILSLNSPTGILSLSMQSLDLGSATDCSNPPFIEKLGRRYAAIIYVKMKAFLSHIYLFFSCCDIDACRRGGGVDCD